MLKRKLPPKAIGLGDFEKNMPTAQVSKKSRDHKVRFLSSRIKHIIYSN